MKHRATYFVLPLLWGCAQNDESADYSLEIAGQGESETWRISMHQAHEDAPVPFLELSICADSEPLVLRGLSPEIRGDSDGDPYDGISDDIDIGSRIKKCWAEYDDGSLASYPVQTTLGMFAFSLHESEGVRGMRFQSPMCRDLKILCTLRPGGIAEMTGPEAYAMSLNDPYAQVTATMGNRPVAGYRVRLGEEGEPFGVNEDGAISVIISP